MINEGAKILDEGIALRASAKAELGEGGEPSPVLERLASSGKKFADAA